MEPPTLLRLGFGEIVGCGISFLVASICVYGLYRLEAYSCWKEQNRETKKPR